MWNVKKYERLGKDLEEYSINRNIVECKVYNHRGHCRRKKRINRNIVECKEAKEAIMKYYQLSY